ncbi:MAG: hypothetical protein JO044_04330 [Mycobacteriaceae bacterium]|nr:hypothetical protein [Mycobacteriaceae bacterium]MBV9639107.1 hypothetical protein [Mycobacteriaceae bacterium]
MRRLLFAAAVIVGATLIARRLGYKVGGDTVVRCRQGHLFTTLWIPGVKFKAIDLGIARLQRCPVGQHWSLVIPARESELTDEQRRQAAQHHDVRIP